MLDHDDLKLIGDAIARFNTGRLSAADFKSLRTPFGLYEQRVDGHWMLRVRLPGGRIGSDQMRAISRAARTHNARLHATTRQDIQFHDLALDAVVPVLQSIHAAGLSTRASGGDAVRNIAACPYAGVCPDEAFDVTPWAQALAEAMAADPLSLKLPRKLKFAFSGCPQDCAAATLADVGFIAKEQNGTPGFSVHVGGGLGANSRVAQLFESFVPAGQSLPIAKTVKCLFAAHGDREHRNRNRLRFLLEKLGMDAFRNLYRQIATTFSATCEAATEPPACLEPPSCGGQPPCSQAASPERGDALPINRGNHATSPGFEAWRLRNVRPQKQTGHCTVEIPLFLGDITPDQMLALADIADRCAERGVRVTNRQNLALCWVSESNLPQLHETLARVALADARPAWVRDIVSCIGPAVCRFGACRSRGLARALAAELEAQAADLQGLEDLPINISGCPNACGRHPAAPIGLSGLLRKVSDRSVPHYAVHLGGHVEVGRTRLAQPTATLPARNVPAFLAALLADFRRSSAHPDLPVFLAHNQDRLAALITRHSALPPVESAPEQYTDWEDLSAL